MAMTKPKYKNTVLLELAEYPALTLDGAIKTVRLMRPWTNTSLACGFSASIIAENPAIVRINRPLVGRDGKQAFIADTINAAISRARYVPVYTDRLYGTENPLVIEFIATPAIKAMSENPVLAPVLRNAAFIDIEGEARRDPETETWHARLKIIVEGEDKSISVYRCDFDQN